MQRRASLVQGVLVAFAPVAPRHRRRLRAARQRRRDRRNPMGMAVVEMAVPRTAADRPATAVRTPATVARTPARAARTRAAPPAPAASSRAAGPPGRVARTLALAARTPAAPPAAAAPAPAAAAPALAAAAPAHRHRRHRHGRQQRSRLWRPRQRRRRRRLRRGIQPERRPGQPPGLVVRLRRHHRHPDPGQRHHRPAAAAAVSGGAPTGDTCDMYALHSTGTGHSATSGYVGFGASVQRRHSAPASGSTSKTQSPYDVSAYDGISFNIKSGSGTAPPVWVEFHNTENVPTPDGTAKYTDVDQYNTRGMLLTSVGTSWQKVYVPFAILGAAILAEHQLDGLLERRPSFARRPRGTRRTRSASSSASTRSSSFSRSPRAPA